eukprot:CCRYP_003508-RG/>CCRYP_003508-RG protein AED:0.49 eAED:1.00 QI:0/0/0/1/0/0/2/0/150
MSNHRLLGGGSLVDVISQEEEGGVRIGPCPLGGRVETGGQRTGGRWWCRRVEEVGNETGPIDPGDGALNVTVEVSNDVDGGEGRRGRSGAAVIAVAFLGGGTGVIGSVGGGRNRFCVGEGRRRRDEDDNDEEEKEGEEGAPDDDRQRFLG